MPRVSVILNSYNQSAYLPEAVKSVLSQSFDDFELIINDNGSTDGSQEILEEYGDPRITLHLHSSNESVTSRFNAAVEEARGDYVSFLYSDDMYLPEKLRMQVDAFETLGPEYGVVYSPYRRLNALSGEVWDQPSLAASGWVFHELLQRPNGNSAIDMVSPMIRRTSLLRHRFNEAIFAEGEAVFFRIALTDKFHFVPTPLCVLRDHAANAGKDLRRNEAMTMQALDVLERHPSLSDTQIRLVLRFRSQLLVAYAWQGARLGEDRSWVRSKIGENFRAHGARALGPRSFGALALSSLPEGLRLRINAAATRLKNHPANQTLTDGFGGSSSS